MAKQWPSRQGNLAAQSTSPYFAPKAFWATPPWRPRGFRLSDFIRPTFPPADTGDSSWLPYRRHRPETLRAALATRHLEQKPAPGPFGFSQHRF